MIIIKSVALKATKYKFNPPPPPCPVGADFLRLLFPLLARAGVDKLRKKGAVHTDVDDDDVADVADVCENIIRLS